VNDLKEKVIGKISLVNGRITFQQLVGPAVTILGGILCPLAMQALIDSAILGGVGALVIGGFACPPLGAVIMGGLIGSLGTGSIIFIVKYFWEKHQYKSLSYLNKILENLIKLEFANTEFRKLMKKSSFHTSRLQFNLDDLRKISFNPSVRCKKAAINICERALDSTKLIIETVNNVNNFDISNLANRQKVFLEDSKTENKVLALK
jgi:hypothetical protein